MDNSQQSLTNPFLGNTGISLGADSMVPGSMCGLPRMIVINLRDNTANLLYWFCRSLRCDYCGPIVESTWIVLLEPQLVGLAGRVIHTEIPYGEWRTVRETMKRNDCEGRYVRVDVGAGNFSAWAFIPTVKNDVQLSIGLSSMFRKSDTIFDSLSKGEIAQRLGISQSALTRKLKGERKWRPGEHERYCQIAGEIPMPDIIPPNLVLPGIIQDIRHRQPSTERHYKIHVGKGFRRPKRDDYPGIKVDIHPARALEVAREYSLTDQCHSMNSWHIFTIDRGETVGWYQRLTDALLEGGIN